jgi:hypothetical protein
MIATVDAPEAPPRELIDPRVAKHGGTRKDAKSTTASRG